MNLLTRTILTIIFATGSIISIEYFLSSMHVFKPGGFIANAISFILLLGTILYLIYNWIAEGQTSTLHLIGYGLIVGFIIASILAFWTYYHYHALHPYLLDLELEALVKKLKSMNLPNKDIRLMKEDYLANPPVTRLAFVRFFISLVLSLFISLLGSFMLKKVITQ